VVHPLPEDLDRRLREVHLWSVSNLRLIDSCITQHKAQGPSVTREKRRRRASRRARRQQIMRHAATGYEIISQSALIEWFL